MSLCDYTPQSFFKQVFDAKKDFNYIGVYELPESEQVTYDPVGFFFFNKHLVYAMLKELRMINNRRTDLRDLLKEMGYIWRFNNVQHQVVNEADWTTRREVASRVAELVRITRAKLGIRERVENMVTGDVIRYWENQIPQGNPTVTSEKMSRTLAMRVPHIEAQYTQPPFAPVSAFNRRVYIHGQ